MARSSLVWEVGGKISSFYIFLFIKPNKNFNQPFTFHHETLCVAIFRTDRGCPCWRKERIKTFMLLRFDLLFVLWFFFFCIDRKSWLSEGALLEDYGGWGINSQSSTNSFWTVFFAINGWAFSCRKQILTLSSSWTILACCTLSIGTQ